MTCSPPRVLAGLAGSVLLLAGAQDGVSLIRRCRYPAQPDTVWALPKTLREISGLATYQGRLLAHDDEIGRVVSIDPRTGRVSPWRTLRGAVRDDFEGIAVIGATAWLITNTARLYSFPVAPSAAPAGFALTDTGLGRRCEFEGLAADTGGVLLLPCKALPKGQGGIVIYRWDTKRGALATPATIVVPDVALAKAGVTGLRPSSIERDPMTRHLLILSSNPAVLVELNAAGGVVALVQLKKHPQAEGMALAANRDLFVSDEGGTGSATLARYRCAR
jgi:uncharacterized protein YjiK